jgi:O-antigen/teichoic acid export membrane protein
LMCLNVGLNYWLIGRYGALGAGIATGASLVAINIVRVVQVRRLLGFHPYRKGFFKLVPAVGAAAAAAVLIRVIAGTSVAGFLGGLAALVVVYGGLALAFGLEDVDRVVLEVIRSRLGQRRGGIE